MYEIQLITSGYFLIIDDHEISGLHIPNLYISFVPVIKSIVLLVIL